MAGFGTGSQELAALGARLKVAGGGGLRVELLRGLKSAASPLVGDVRAAALAQLPKRGGLAARVANSPIKVQVRTGVRTASVKIVASEHDARSTNFGGVRHPVFGHRDRWVAQDIPAAQGWFTTTLTEKAPQVTGEILAVMVSVSRKIGGAV